jgi:hypothetical protein
MSHECGICKRIAEIGPVYFIDEAIRRSEQARPSAEELAAIKRILLSELEKRDGLQIRKRASSGA